MRCAVRGVRRTHPAAAPCGCACGLWSVVFFHLKSTFGFYCENCARRELPDATAGTVTEVRSHTPRGQVKQCGRARRCARRVGERQLCAATGAARRRDYVYRCLEDFTPRTGPVGREIPPPSGAMDLSPRCRGHQWEVHPPIRIPCATCRRLSRLAGRASWNQCERHRKVY